MKLSPKLSLSIEMANLKLLRTKLSLVWYRGPGTKVIVSLPKAVDIRNANQFLATN